MDTLKVERRLSTDRHACRKGYSTETTLKYAVSFIEEKFERGGFVFGLLLDIEGAFNHTNTDIICNEAERNSIHPVII